MNPQDTAAAGQDFTEDAKANEDHPVLENGVVNGTDSSELPKPLAAYKQLSSRRVDLVGDYAGNELFLVEGDSLLLHCFSDSKLDFENGFQMLHACYLVENFLYHLKQRKCNFHVAFLEDHKAASIPPWVDEKVASKYELARAAIIRHMQVNLPTTYPEVKVSVFASIHEKAFNDYLSNAGIYFIMAHDAAKPLHSVSQADEAATNHKLILRGAITSFINNGYNVALINGLEWRDTKVMTMVLEGSQDFRDIYSPSTPESSSGNVGNKSEIPELKKLEESYANLTERERLTVIAASRMMPESVDKENVLALLYHTALLDVLPLSSRRINETEPKTNDWLRGFCDNATEMLQSQAWLEHHESAGAVCDTGDMFDGRLMNVILTSGTPATSDMHPKLREKFQQLQNAVETLSGSTLPAAHPHEKSSETSPKSRAVDELPHASVLPFHNPVFDRHLESIRLSIDEDGEEESPSSARIFREVSHWNNAKRPVGQKVAPAVSAKQEFWAARRNQWFMAEMRTYAASLTNAVGKTLDPETIVVGAKSATANTPAEKDLQSGKKPAKKENTKTEKPKGGKKAAKSSGKAAIMESIAANTAKKEEAATGKIVQAWHTIVKNLEAERDLPSRYTKAKEYLAGLTSDKRTIVGAEVGLYMLSTLVEYWIQMVKKQDRTQVMGLAALIWHSVKSIPKLGELTKTIVAKMELTRNSLGLPLELPEAPKSDRSLPFKFALPASTADSFSLGLSSQDFQLLHCGPYLDRSIDSAPDPRVDFEPDGWQRKVLDGIDANKSMFVVAPTSAGKTFISFYAMRKVLDADDDGVLVYVAPTKALVNQIAAEIQARYSKKFRFPGKSVWAIHTRDYRINNPTGCQVLVTVPHVLQIMLLAPSHANSWSNRVKRIIFDEVHSIGNADDGVVWEQLLLLAPCPIIALSATVGNPEEFSGWLSSTQKAMDIDLELVQHPHRYSDLRKYFYNPPKKLVFTGLGQGRSQGSFSKLGLDGTTGFKFVHPVTSLVQRSRGIPDDLSLEARDCLTLWQALIKYSTEDHPIPEELNPAKALPSVVKKIDVLKWEKGLKNILAEWMADQSSPFEKVVSELNGLFYDETREEEQITRPSYVTSEDHGHSVAEDDLLETTLPLLCSLHDQDALPAILFNYERGLCERICQKVVSQLQEAEKAYKDTNPKWKAQLKAWEEWKKVQEKNRSKQAKPSKAGKSREDGEGDKMSKGEQLRDAASTEYSAFEGFDPEAPLDGYHFANHKKLQVSELQEHLRQLGRRNIQQWLIDAISRGIGVHHAGMNRKYRQVVEILFRKGFLRVVIATGTLALGINMPTRVSSSSGIYSVTQLTNKT